MLLAVAFGGPLCLFQFYYKRFRIKSVTLLWLGVGILQWFVLSAAKRNPDFDAVVGSYADYEENLLVLVILVSLFRFISLSVFQREFILASWTEPEEEQQPKMLDYLFSLVGFLTLAMLATII